MCFLQTEVQFNFSLQSEKGSVKWRHLDSTSPFKEMDLQEFLDYQSKIFPNDDVYYVDHGRVVKTTFDVSLKGRFVVLAKPGEEPTVDDFGGTSFFTFFFC